MKKFNRAGLRYRITAYDRVEFHYQKITSLNVVIELKAINTKTNREILFVSDNDRIIEPALIYTDKLDKTEFDIQKRFYISKYIRASYENGKLEFFINNDELAKVDCKIEYKLKEFSKDVITGTIEVGNRLSSVTSDFKISYDEFNDILSNNKFCETDTLMLDKIINYEVDI